MHPGDSWPPGPSTATDPAVLTVTVDDGPKGGPYDLIDLTGATIETVVVKSSRELFLPGATSVIAPTTSIRDQTTNKGEMTFRIEQGAFANLPLARYSWRFTVTFPDGSVTTYLQGQIRVTTGRQ